jgi:aspartyl-tRNA(Asn)/glutamyl-tRNA(Gln) amidotransferase subunit A
MSATDLADCTATELARLFLADEASPVDATRAVLARIERVNSTLHAFCLVAADDALAAARQSELRWRAGAPLSAIDGVPTSIKDLILTRGWPTLRGSRTTDPSQSWDIDAPATARDCARSGRGAARKDLHAGVRLQRRDQLAAARPQSQSLGLPQDARRVIGRRRGSGRGGPRAALLGTDGAGSVRIPATFCGTFGLKPSFGRVPAYPLSPFGTVAHLGPLTMSVRDAALMMNVLKQPDARRLDIAAARRSRLHGGLDDGIRGVRIAWSPSLGYAKNVHAEIAAACARAVATFADLGARVEEIDPGIEDPLEITTGLWFVGAWSVWNTLTPEQQAVTDPDFAAEADLGSTYSALDIQRTALASRRAGGPYAPIHAAL